MAERSERIYNNIVGALYSQCNKDAELAAVYLRGTSAGDVKRVWRESGLEAKLTKHDEKLRLPPPDDAVSLPVIEAFYKPCSGSPAVAQQYGTYPTSTYERYWKAAGLKINKGQKGGRRLMVKRPHAEDYKLSKEALKRCNGDRYSAEIWLGWSEQRLTNVLTRRNGNHRASNGRNGIRFGSLRVIKSFGRSRKSLIEA